MEESDSTPVDSRLDASEESTSNADLTSGEHSGLYIPNFLGEANDGEWGLMIRMARAIQVDEQQQKHCFVCQSPDHFVRNFPQDDELTCLLDNGAQLNFMTPDYAVKRGLQIFTLE